MSRAREPLREVRLERAVELDGVDVRDPLGEVVGEDAEARADLEHDVVGVELGEAADDAEDVLVDEEVLAESPLRRDGSFTGARTRPPRSRRSGAELVGILAAGLGERPRR